MKEIALVISFGLLGFIFLRRYLAEEKHTSLRDVFFPRKHLVHKQHLVEHSGTSAEVTADEFIAQDENIDPKDAAKADSLVKKAELFVQKGRGDEAEKAFVQALSLNPHSIDAHKGLALYYLHQQQWSKAETLYRKLVATITDDATLFSNFGLALFSQDKLADATDAYRKALAIDDTRAGRVFSLGQILYAQELFDEALDLLIRAHEMAPKNLDYALTLAHFYVDRSLENEARDLLRAILEKYPEHEEATEMMAKLG